MALKALDQRVANNSSPVGSSSTNASPTPARAPPAANLARSENTGAPSAPPTNGRSKSGSESDEAGKAKSEVR